MKGNVFLCLFQFYSAWVQKKVLRNAVFFLSDVALGVVLSSFTFLMQATEKGFYFVWAMSKKYEQICIS